MGRRPAEGLADRAVRPVADAVRHRGRRGAAVGVRDLAATTRGVRHRPAGAPRPAADRPAAVRPARAVLAEPDPHGRVLHDPPLPAARPRPGRAADGVKMLPASIAMFFAAAAGSRLSSRYAVRAITRAGLATIFVACLALLATIKPDLADAAFALSMALLGVGMGLVASQLGLVVQSSVDASGRGEAGGLQYTGQQLGSSLGVAADRRDRAGGPRHHLHDDGPRGRADQRRRRDAGRARGRVRARLRVVRPDRAGRPGRGARRGDDRRRSSTTTSRRSSCRSRPGCSPRP